MTRAEQIEHEFVEFMPHKLAQGTLYISIPYATCSHLCLCGCGNRVVTPLSPTDWRLTFDGETVSLEPSIGNWSFDCQSRYWIRRNRVRWAARWSRRKIEENRARARQAAERYYSGNDSPDAVEPAAPDRRPALLKRMVDRLKR